MLGLHSEAETGVGFKYIYLVGSRSDVMDLTSGSIKVPQQQDFHWAYHHVYLWKADMFIHLLRKEKQQFTVGYSP